jgi:hypothetical protein
MDNFVIFNFFLGGGMVYALYVRLPVRRTSLLFSSLLLSEESPPPPPPPRRPAEINPETYPGVDRRANHLATPHPNLKVVSKEKPGIIKVANVGGECCFPFKLGRRLV